MRHKRGQQAMEYLITHGWMIMVTILVAGALVYFGVFNSDRYVPSQCVFTFDFSCDQYVVKTDGEVRVKLSNQLSDPIRATNFTCTYDDGSYISMNSVPSSDWFPGNQIEFICPDGGTTLDSGRKAKVDVSLVYRKITGGFSKTVSGMIVANPS